MRILSDNQTYFQELFPNVSITAAQPSVEWQNFSDHRAVCGGEVPSPLDHLCASEACMLVEDFADTSQYDRLLKMKNISRPICAIARTGFGFHGKNQNTWHTVAGNLHLCYALPFWGTEAQLPFRVAELLRDAMGEACQAASGVPAGCPMPAFEIKLPNDILLNGKKIAGILASLRYRSQNLENIADSRLLTLGIGVNLEKAPELVETIYASAGCLSEAWISPGAIAIVASLNRLLLPFCRPV